MSTTATRLITLIMLLQRQPNQKAADLAEKLGVSVRSLHRYIAMLDEMGIPVYSERGPQGGFSLVRGYKMPPLIFTPQEASAICIGAGLVNEIWGQLYHEAAQGALAKIENVLPEEQLSEITWARRTLVASQVQRPGLQPFASLLGALRNAIRLQHRVKLLYQGGTHTHASWREFDPYALAFRSGWWYVIGRCHLRQAIRAFRVDRIQQFEQLATPYQIPPDFDAHAHLAFEFKGAAQIHIRLLLSAEVAHFALSTPAAWERMEPQPDGSVIVATSLPDLYWAAALTLSYGPAATVLEPDALIQLVFEWASEIAARYQSKFSANDD